MRKKRKSSLSTANGGIKSIQVRLSAIMLLILPLLLTACNLLFPDEKEFVVIKKDEWDLIEDFTHPKDRPYVENDSLALGADKNGTNNQKALHNTAQIQKALDHYMSLGHKYIRLEKGEYYVGGRKERIIWDSGTQNWINPEMIRIQPKHSGLHFDLGGSTLKLEPHDRMESRIIWLYSDRTGKTKNIKIFNGTLIGDRLKHKFTDKQAGKQLSHEWGTGIDIWGEVENIELYNLNISEVTGDCIGANGKNITIRDCNISRGRRNGIVSVYVDGLTIYNNIIHCIYNAGGAWDCKDPNKGGCKYCPAGHPDSQHEYFGSSIGAEACIAFEHTSNDYFDKQINIKIYNNFLDGQKPEYITGTSEYLRDSALNTHWGTYAMWVYNNDIIGDWEWSCGGSNTLIENNRFLGRGYKGYVISRGLIASGPTLDTGRSAASYVVIRNNYFKNYNVIVGGASGGVSDSQPDWRHDYAIVDNTFVYDEPRIFYNNNGSPTSTNYYTGICASVNNTVILGNVFDVRDGGFIVNGGYTGNTHLTAPIKPLACAIYIDVFNRDWKNRLPDYLKVDMYIASNIFRGSIWREKYYVLNNDQGLQALDQYIRPTDTRMPSNYSETNNYTAAHAKYQEILRKTISVGNIWGRTK